MVNKKSQPLNKFTKKELSIFNKINTPVKIQDFLNKLAQNFEYTKDTCYSPRLVLKHKKAQCMEGAMFAATALRIHGYKPLIVDLESTKDDWDHVIAVFRQHNCWGAISKTNNVVLRYREPIYKTIRELVMSYFHEYFLNKNGKKTLRTFSRPINLTKFDKKDWMTSNEEVWYIPDFITTVPHNKILSQKQISTLRKADFIEIKAGKLTQYKRQKLRK